MNPSAELDLVVYGATGYTGRLVAEHLAKRYGSGHGVRWAMAGRSAGKLQEVRDLIGAPADIPLIVADADDPNSLGAMLARTKAVATTVGPYQLYGAKLVEACARTGCDYLDLCGEPNFMRAMIDAHEAQAKASGARICFSCGFDSIPFELGVLFLQETAEARLGHALPRVKGRVRGLQGGLSGGTAASGAATMAAAQKDPSVIGLLMNPFALTPGFEGPPQPTGAAPEYDPDLGAWAAPFMMAAINSKNVHRSNALQDHRYGADFVYDEMMLAANEEAARGGASAFDMSGAGAPKPGEGPTKEEREAGFYDLLFVGLDRNGRQLRVSVYGDKDPGYGSTSKILAEAGLCLVQECEETPGGVWTPGAAMGTKLIARLEAEAGLTFKVEAG